MTDIADRTVHGVLEQLAAERADRNFLYFEEQRFTYGAIEQMASRAAKGFENLGVAQNDKVGIMMSNRPEFLFVWFGLSKLGAVEVPLNIAHKGEILTYMIRQSDCSTVVIEAAFFEVLSAVANRLPKLSNVILLDWPCAATLPKLRGIRTVTYEVLADNRGDYTRCNVKPADPWAIMFTSGTTGPSKGAVMPHAYALAQAEIICGMAEYTEVDRLYNALPLFHGNAQVLSTMPALISGASMLLAKRFSASQFWYDIRRHGCTEFNYIGGILSILLKSDMQADDADNPLRVMVGAGANAQVLKAFEERFKVTLIESYGMSEIGAPLNNTFTARRPGSCGTVNAYYEVKLVDDEGGEVDTGEPGELLVRPRRSNSMMLEYYGMPESTVEAWRDLWFHTGDYLKRDDEGYFYFIDRKKDALRRRGENISSFEVERCVNAHPAVLESAAVAVRSDLGEDEVMICVATRAGASVTPMELIHHCEARMARFMVPRYVRMLEQLPKTPTERVQKFRLRNEGVTADTFDREEIMGRSAST
jgi:crotonobetaine/carnitine-CoA ligase